MYRLFIILWVICVCLVVVNESIAAPHAPYAMILSYDLGGEEEKISQSLQDFVGHLDILVRLNKAILPLSSVRSFLETGRGGVAVITFENITPRALEKLLPVLRKEAIPCTIYLDAVLWSREAEEEILTSLRSDNHIEIGLQTQSDVFYKDETAFRSALNRSVSSYKVLLGQMPEHFMPANGHYSEMMRDVLEEYNFKTVLGGGNSIETNAHSSVLQRFKVTNNISAKDSFKKIIRLRPLACKDRSPASTLVTSSAPIVGFTIDNTLRAQNRLKCFLQGQGPLEPVFITTTRIELHPVLEPKRDYAMSCMLSEENEEEGDDDLQWYWLGFYLRFN